MEQSKAIARIFSTNIPEMPPFRTWAALMIVKIGLSQRNWSASLVMDNLLNRFYYEYLSNYRDPFASGEKIPEPGRNFFGQLKYDF